MEKKHGLRDIGLGIGIFLLAILPRLFGLGVFMTPDERRWISRSVLFFSAILRGDWADTFQTGHPGVTTKWTGALGLLGKYLLESGGSFSLEGLKAFLEKVPVYPTVSADYLPPCRLPTALLAAAFVAASYFFIRRLFGPKIALLSASLLAFDPFYLAHSRVIHHDALAATFMSLSLWSLTIYLWQSRSLRYLILAAFSAGLAVLSKGTALFLAPFTALTLLSAWWYDSLGHLVWWSDGQNKELSDQTTNRPTSPPWGEGKPPQMNHYTVYRILYTVAIWGAAAGATFTAFWPMMWVEPVGALKGMLETSLGYAAEAHSGGNFFLGRIADDPGPFFYPVTFFLRTTPLTSLGCLVALVFWGREICFLRLKSQAIDDSEESRRKRAFFTILAYAILFGAFMTLGDKKFDRYLLPIYPALEVLAAVGLCELEGRLSPRLIVGKALPFGVLLLQTLFSLPHYPYYLSFYNPLIGGGQLAPHLISVGWGEGLDEAARYLNGKENAAEIKIASWYHREIMPFLVGEVDRLERKSDKDIMPWHRSDYVLFYINQVQRGQPDEAFVRYLSSLAPEYTVRLKGIDYAWIYPAPEYIPPEVVPAQHAQRALFEDDLIFLGYDLDGSRVPLDGKVWLSLYWQGLRQMDSSYRIYLKLVNGVYHVWGEQEGRPLWDRYPTENWPEGAVVKDMRAIEVLPGTPPGFYQVAVNLFDQAKGRWVKPEGGGELVIGPVEIPRRPPPPPEKLDIAHRLEAELGGKVRFLGYNLGLGLKSQERSFRPGGRLHLTLFWECLAGMNENYTVFTHLVDENGEIWGQKDNEPVDGFYPTSLWQPGEILRDQYDLAISSAAPPGEYSIEVGLYRPETGKRLPVQLPEERKPADRIILQKMVLQ